VILNFLTVGSQKIKDKRGRDALMNLPCRAKNQPLLYRLERLDKKLALTIYAGAWGNPRRRLNT